MTHARNNATYTRIRESREEKGIELVSSNVVLSALNTFYVISSNAVKRFATGDDQV